MLAAVQRWVDEEAPLRADVTAESRRSVLTAPVLTRRARYDTVDVERSYKKKEERQNGLIACRVTKGVVIWECLPLRVHQ